MKKLVTISVFMFVSALVFGQTNYSTTYQSGYFRSDGTYVQPHYKTTINQTNHDNFSTHGNTNVYKGLSGYRAKEYSSGASNYGSGKTIYTGPKGGQYYYNSNGNKVYVPMISKTLSAGKVWTLIFIKSEFNLQCSFGIISKHQV